MPAPRSEEYRRLDKGWRHRLLRRDHQPCDGSKGVKQAKVESGQKDAVKTGASATIGKNLTNATIGSGIRPMANRGKKCSLKNPGEPSESKPATQSCSHHEDSLLDRRKHTTSAMWTYASESHQSAPDSPRDQQGRPCAPSLLTNPSPMPPMATSM